MSVVSPLGFLASGIASGIKTTGALDLSLVAAVDGPVPAAATFTTNRAAAAPVQVSRAHLESSKGRVGAVVLNSGCANAATGSQGLEASRETTRRVAAELGIQQDEVLVCSTGLIGPQLPVDALFGGIPDLVAKLGSDEASGLTAAQAIMTTDTVPKMVRIEGDGFVVGGMAKGAGMIAPNMATMLCVITTDAKVSSSELSVALRGGVSRSFNELIVDGATSTNDTVIALASGLAGPVRHRAFVDAVRVACASLAEQMAADAEGTTRVASIVVSGAKNDHDAQRAARKVAGSLLVKASLFGSDPYWGRIVSELGSSGAAFELDRVAVRYGGVLVFEKGVEVPHDRPALVEYLQAKRVEIACDLGIGKGAATVLTTDLGHGYIDENMRTS